MNNYELMVIFTPVLSEEDHKAAQKKYAAFVKDNGGVVVHENPWGLKSLAYPIQKKTTGLYWVSGVQAPSDFNEKLRSRFSATKPCYVSCATKLDKYAVEYNGRQRSGVPAGTRKSRGVSNGKSKRNRAPHRHQAGETRQEVPPFQEVRHQIWHRLQRMAEFLKKFPERAGKIAAPATAHR